MTPNVISAVKAQVEKSWWPKEADFTKVEDTLFHQLNEIASTMNVMVASWRYLDSIDNTIASAFATVVSLNGRAHKELST